MKRGTEATVLISILVMGSSLSLVFLPEEVSAYTKHNPILIDGNGGFTTANGVTGGSGIPSDPYIIEGWEIDASTTHAIKIRNTDAHFIIRNSYLHSGWHSYSGVFLLHVLNGRTENSVVRYNLEGIELVGSRNVTVVNNSVKWNTGDGISLYDSHWNSIANNTFFENPFGIYVDSSKRNVIANNNVTKSTDIGIRVYGSLENEIANNSITSSRGFGIYLRSSNDNSISGNSVTSNLDSGIHHVDSSNNTIASNTCSDNRNAFISFAQTSTSYTAIQ